MKNIMLTNTAKAVLILNGAFWFTCPSFAELPEYPAAKRLSIIEDIHGTEVQDPYRWMEETDSGELKDWVEAQTAIADEFVAGAEYDAITRRIEELSRFDLRFAGKRRNNRLFYLLRPKDGGQVELYVDEGKNPRLLLRSDQIPDTDFAETYLGGRGFARSQWPDRAGNLVAYGYTDGATPAVRFRIVDARSGSAKLENKEHGLRRRKLRCAFKDRLLCRRGYAGHVVGLPVVVAAGWLRGVEGGLMDCEGLGLNRVGDR